MNRLALLALAACSAPGAHAPTPPTNARRVIVISIDGLMPDVFLDPDAHGMKIPTLRALVAGGASARVHGVMPTVTYPSHTTMVTGVPPAVHGIVSNKPLDPLFANYDGWRWYAEAIATPTIYDALEAQHRPTALIVWPVSVGAHVTYLVPEYWRAGGPDDQKLIRALSTPGAFTDLPASLWDSLTPPDIKDPSQFAILDHVLDRVHPDLVLMHVFELDDAQHDHGPWSPEAKAVIERVDAQLGKLVQRLATEPATLLVVSDHGFAPIEHELRLGVLFDAAHLLHPKTADVASLASGGTALIYVLEPKRAADVDAALAPIADHVARRIDHDELVRLGGDPKASFALVAQPGYGFADTRTGDAITATGPHGTHGWPPDDPAMAASLIAYGPGIPHTSLGTVDMTQIAPTLARWLAVPLPTATGAPIAALVTP